MTLVPPAVTGFDPKAEIVSIPAQSSLDFLEAVFDCYAQGRLFAITRPGIDLAAYGLTGTPHTLPEAPRLGWGKGQYSPDAADAPDAPAQIVFTSGTEGLPKAMVLSRAALDNVVTRLNRVMQVGPEIREYIGVPVTYSFGLGRARAVAAAGGRFFLPERFDPSEIRRMLEADEINAVSAVPSLWKTVLQMPEAIGAAGAKLRWIEIGSQYMSGTDKAALRALFPNARIVQHYGLTEASRSTFLNISAASEAELESVGPANDPEGGVEVRLDEEGAICIRGPHVALGQLQPGTSAELVALRDAEGWLVTRDRGAIENGFLYYHGRLDDQINVSGIKLAAEALEREIALLVPQAAGRFAVTGIPDAARGEIVRLGVEAQAGDLSPLIAQAGQVVLERAGLPGSSALQVLEVEALPRTQTDKIQRRALRALEAPQPQAAPTATLTEDTAPLSDAEAELAQTWKKVLGAAPVSAGVSFYDMGGDSLSSVQIGLVMERAGYSPAAVRATLEGRSLSEISAIGQEQGLSGDPGTEVQALPDHTVRSWAINIARGIMVLSVLFSHWGPGLFGRLGLTEWVDRYLSIFSRMGTPGFAAVFGIGVGTFMLPGFAEKRASVFKRTTSSFWLVLSGIVLTAVVILTLNAMRGREIDGARISFAFYSVLAYYAFILVTARFWLPPLARIRRPVLIFPLIALICWGCWQVALWGITDTAQSSLLEFFRLMLRAGYNIFKMSAVALLGAAIGYWYVTQTDTKAASQSLFALGGASSILCIALGMQAYGLDAFSARGGPVYQALPGLLLYVSLASFMVGGFALLLWSWPERGGVLRRVLQILVVIGGLALPVYVFHGLVIPLKNILALLGLPGSIGLVLTMGGFLAAMFYGGRRLYRMYFA